MGPISSIWDIPRIMIRRIWVILLIVLVGIPSVLFYALSQPRVYEATAVVQIEAAQVVERLTSQTGGGAASGTLNPNSELELIEQQLMSRDHILSILDEFQLFVGIPSVTERVALVRRAVQIVELIDPEQAWRPDAQPSGLVITVRLDDPDIAAAIANTFLDRVLEEAQERTSGRTARTLEFLVAEESRLTGEIEDLEFAYSEFRQANAGALPAAIASQRTQLSRLEQSRIDIEEQIIELESESGRLLAEARLRQQELLNQRLGLVTDAIAEIQAVLATAPEVERQTHVYDRQLAQLQEELGVITERRAQAAMNQLLEVRNQAERFEVLETAIPPEYPVSTSRKKLALAGGVMVALLACAAALTLEILDGRLRSARQFEKELGVQPVIVIPNLRSQRQVRRGRVLWIGVVTAIVVGAAGYLGGWFRNIADRMPRAQNRQLAVVMRRTTRN
ncbi:Wzz/FepE/Etk N-terminal domain-containing protein [Nioella aestuarii]|uniref:Wzz/FepE/Etk N-terminal domain-containing protein n=1 Tax=Nioella aestuarii TaxID=1662864 RepID=UPI003D7FCE38